ncbi:MAG: hypothetical protein AVDCRST_MAG15-2347, partial [uncultured Rubellimicrobium sp.]
ARDGRGIGVAVQLCGPGGARPLPASAARDPPDRQRRADEP